MRNVCVFTLVLLCVCKSSNEMPNRSENVTFIDSVYDLVKIAPSAQWNTVFFATQKNSRNILIQDSQSVLRVLDRTPDSKWALISQMPADPEEARGTNETIRLFYVPARREVRCSDIPAGVCSWIAFSNGQIVYSTNGKEDSMSLQALKARSDMR